MRIKLCKTRPTQFILMPTSFNHTKQDRFSEPTPLLRRAASIIYDALLLSGVLLFASVPIVAIFQLEYGTPLYPLFILYLYLLSLIYFCWFWTHGGQTLGMKSWRLKLARVDGNAVQWRDAIIRFLLATGWLLLLSMAGQFQAWINPSVLGFVFWAALVLVITGTLGSREKRSYYDYLTSTRLIYQRKH